MTIDVTSQYSWPTGVSTVATTSSPNKADFAEKFKTQTNEQMRGAEAAEAVDPLAQKLLDEEQNPSDRPTEEDKGESKEAELQKAVESLREYVQNVKRHLEFSVDSDSGREIIRVIDSETEEVIREIPSEEAIKLSQQLIEAGGRLIHTQA